MEIDLVKWEQDQVVYREGDIADSFFMISTGAVSLKTMFGEEFIQYKVGDTFGESDVLLGETRDCKAMSMCES